MKLVGATDWFIMWPFMIEGMILGFMGSSVSGVLPLCRLSGMHRQTRAGSALSSGNCRGGACRKALCQSCYTWCVNGGSCRWSFHQETPGNLNCLPFFLSEASCAAQHRCLSAARTVITELTAKRDQLQEVSGQVDQTKQQLLTIKRKEKGVLSELEATEMRLEKAKSRLTSLEKQVKDVEKRIREAEQDLVISEKELALAEKRLEERLSVLKNRLRAMYMWGPGNYMEALFAASSFTEFLGRYDYLRMIAENDAECLNEIELEIQGLSDRMEEVEKKKVALENQRVKFASTKVEFTEQEIQLGVQVKERETQLTKLQTEKSQVRKGFR
jgi:peptidoglycan hydrolase CwlO-like protein